MANYFFDTSALANLYRTEQGTPEVERILREPGSVHYISRLAAVELQSVFALKVRTQEITTHDLQQLQKTYCDRFYCATISRSQNVAASFSGSRAIA